MENSLLKYGLGGIFIKNVDDYVDYCNVSNDCSTFYSRSCFYLLPPEERERFTTKKLKKIEDKKIQINSFYFLADKGSPEAIDFARDLVGVEDNEDIKDECENFSKKYSDTNIFSRLFIFWHCYGCKVFSAEQVKEIIPNPNISDINISGIEFLMEKIINDNEQIHLLLKDWFDLPCYKNFNSTSLNITVEDFKKLNDCQINSSWYIWFYYLMLRQDNFNNKRKAIKCLEVIPENNRSAAALYAKSRNPNFEISLEFAKLFGKPQDYFTNKTIEELNKLPSKGWNITIFLLGLIALAFGAFLLHNLFSLVIGFIVVSISAIVMIWSSYDLVERYSKLNESIPNEELGKFKVSDKSFSIERDNPPLENEEIKSQHQK